MDFFDALQEHIKAHPWIGEAPCNDADPEMFFPEVGQNTSEPKRVCDTCPFTTECEDLAYENNERFGIWAGRSARLLRRDRQRAA